jgi:hypothetical protein
LGAEEEWLFRGGTPMASFVARYGKKRLRLAQLEGEFLALLASEVNQTRLAEAVETIRAAHVRALKEKHQKFALSEKNSTILAGIEQEIRRWMGLSKNAIINGYSDPKHRRKMSSAVRRAAKS